MRGGSGENDTKYFPLNDMCPLTEDTFLDIEKNSVFIFKFDQSRIPVSRLLLIEQYF